MADAYIIFTSPRGVFNFAMHDMPTIGRRIVYKRPNESGSAFYLTIAMTLTGWFEGDEHAEIVAKYKALCDTLRATDVKVTYFDGQVTVLDDKIVFIDDIAEPDDWKQYTGDYSLNFHYFEEIQTGSYLNVSASYSSPSGSYMFEHTPLWSSKSENVRSDWGGRSSTPGGVPLGSKINITLDGELAASSHANMIAKIEAMKQAFKSDGTLNYGYWSDSVKVVSPPSFGPTLPYFVCPYQIVVGYTSAGLYEFSSTRTFGRINQMPDIRKRKFCPTDFVRENRPSGQEITYELSARGGSLQQVRTLLRAEAINLVIPGGIEMEGGTEVWDDMLNKITISIKKYHVAPVLQNIES